MDEVDLQNQIARLEVRVEHLERNQKAFEHVINTLLRVSIPGSAAAYRGLAEMRNVVAAAGQETKEMDFLLDRLRDALLKLQTESGGPS